MQEGYSMKSKGLSHPMLQFPRLLIWLQYVCICKTYRHVQTRDMYIHEFYVFL